MGYVLQQLTFTKEADTAAEILIRIDDVNLVTTLAKERFKCLFHLKITLKRNIYLSEYL